MNTIKMILAGFCPGASARPVPGAGKAAHRHPSIDKTKRRGNLEVSVMTHLIENYFVNTNRYNSARTPGN